MGDLVLTPLAPPLPVLLAPITGHQTRRDAQCEGHASAAHGDAERDGAEFGT